MQTVVAFKLWFTLYIYLCKGNLLNVQSVQLFIWCVVSDYIENVRPVVRVAVSVICDEVFEKANELPSNVSLKTCFLIF